MDKNLQFVETMRIERTVQALRNNRFDASFIQTREELFSKIQEYLRPGMSCSVGGSMTLYETGVIDFLESGKYEYFDRYAQGANVQEVFAKALGCDVYFMSSNAITEDGRLLNVDGRGNRVAALVYGPKKVVVIAGKNKIVENLDEARRRLRETARPTNSVRLGRNTPCVKTGVCADCRSEERICSFEVVSECQMIKNRIAVLILPEDYGY